MRVMLLTRLSLDSRRAYYELMIFSFFFFAFDNINTHKFLSFFFRTLSCRHLFYSHVIRVRESELFLLPSEAFSSLSRPYTLLQYYMLVCLFRKIDSNTENFTHNHTFVVNLQLLPSPPSSPLPNIHPKISFLICRHYQ